VFWAPVEFLVSEYYQDDLYTEDEQRKKIGLYTDALPDLSLTAALDWAPETGTGGFPNVPRCGPDKLRGNARAGVVARVEFFRPIILTARPAERPH